MIAFERRASAVLYNILRTHHNDGPFLLPANICPIVPLVFFKASQPFEFIDIAPDTLGIDPDAAMARWYTADPAPAGIIYVRSYGAVIDASAFFADIKTIAPQALIVDDRCLCVPDFSGSLVAHADVALYSTGYAKFADVGAGGFGVIRDGIRYERTELRFDPGDLDEITTRYKYSLASRIQFTYEDSNWLDTSAPGENWDSYRECVELETARMRQHKEAVNRVYTSRLPKEVQFPEDFQSWRFNIHVGDKARVMAAIQRSGLFASGHYDPLANLFGPGEASRARLLHDHVINLFNDRYFSLDQANRMTDLLSKLDLISSGSVLPRRAND